VKKHKALFSVFQDVKGKGSFQLNVKDTFSSETTLEQSLL